MCIDLHTHSLFSDGSLSPRELVALGLENRLRCLALTDHDTVEGIPEFLAAGEELGLFVLGGVEISTTLREHTIHVLGYGIEGSLPTLQEWLRPVQEGRANRNRVILGKLNELGIPIDAAELEAISTDGQTGRPHFARLLVQKGVVATVDEAFGRYLAHGKPAWAPRFSYTATEAIEIIHRLGGKAVWAHPGMLHQDFAVVAAVLRELADHGLDGVEAHYPPHSRALRKRLEEAGAKLGLLATGGSDFHGATRPTRRMARAKSDFCPPTRLLEPLLAALGRPMPFTY